MSNIGKIQLAPIVEEMKRSYLDYAMSVIVSRALPDVRDGLKPVQRRIIFAMHQQGLHHTSRYQKSAAVVGEVMKNLHPHGDAPIYEAMVRMAQNFSMRYMLVDGQGNFGSIDGDSPAAMRYTEARLSAISEELLRDINKETVGFIDNYSGTTQEPTLLPSVIPNLLLNGAQGIAVGMATQIPPHNLGEICDALIYMIENPAKEITKSSKPVIPTPIKSGEESQDSNLEISHSARDDKSEEPEKTEVTEETLTTGYKSEASVEDLMKFIKGPDFPTGASIYDKTEILAAYATGKGRIVMRAKAEIEETKTGKMQIIVSEIPYQVNKSTLIARIADLVKEKKLEGIADLRDESDRKQMVRIVIDLKRDGKPQSVLNNLYKHTTMQSVFNVNMVALVDGINPQLLTLKHILEQFIGHRQIVVRKRSEFELREAKAREHILEGLKIAVDNIDEVIETIKKSEDADEARTNLMKKFKLSELQAIAILDMQLRRLAALEIQKIEDELKMVRDTIVTITAGGYIKRQAPMSFRTQARGGKGVMGISTKETDAVSHIFYTETHASILFFTDKGRVFQVKVWEIPESQRAAKGQAVVNLINIEGTEKVTAVLPVNYGKTKAKEDLISITRYLLMCTKKGTVKKTAIEEYTNIRKNGLVAIKLDSGDTLGWVTPTSGENDMIIVSKMGQSIRFSEKQVKTTHRDTSGVRGIKFKLEDEVVSLNWAKNEEELLIIMENGLGKKTKISAWNKQGRGGQGVKAAQVTAKTGSIVTAEVINKDTDTLVLTSNKGQLIKMDLKQVPTLQRQTQGVILMRTKDGEKVAAATVVSSKDRAE